MFRMVLHMRVFIKDTLLTLASALATAFGQNAVSERAFDIP